MMISGIGGSDSIDVQSLSQMRQEMFKKTDANGDGKIDKNEMASFLKSKAPDGTNVNSLVDDVFKKVETNNDGTISASENDTALSQMENQIKNLMSNNNGDVLTLLESLKRDSKSKDGKNSSGDMQSLLLELNQKQATSGSYNQSGGNAQFPMLNTLKITA